MTQETKNTIAKGLDVAEVSVTRGFSHTRVVDLRCDCDRARPIEEAVLRRLRNLFVTYEQAPMQLDLATDEYKTKVIEILKTEASDTLVISDDLAQLAAVLSASDIAFTAKSFYVVETGKGQVVHTMPEAAVNELPKYGTFSN